MLNFVFLASELHVFLDKKHYTLYYLILKYFLSRHSDKLFTCEVLRMKQKYL